MKAVLMMMAMAALTWAADVSGTWSGPLELTRNGETKADSAHLVLKQEGDQVTGSLGPNAEKQTAITKGTMTGDDLVLEAKLPEKDRVVVLTLKLDSGKLTGTLDARDPDGQGMTGKMTLTKGQ